MKFITIDIENWERREFYDYYMNMLRTTYSLTTDIDVTKLLAEAKRRGMKIYPVQIFAVSSVVNRFREFRMDFDTEGQLGYWDEVYPSYTVFNKERETFSGIWTDYDASFAEFYARCLQDIEEYSSATYFEPKPRTKPNTFNVSSVPWIGFSALNFNIIDRGRNLLPIFTMGRFAQKEGRMMMPLAMQVHHAVCDGFHIARFVKALQEMMDNCQQWLNKRDI